MKTDRGQPCPCPPQEVLSAWHDGEMKDPQIERHLGECEPCRDLVDYYRRVDLTLSGLMQTDAGLADRIIGKCRCAEQEPPLFSRIFFQAAPALRYAAAGIAVAAVVAALVTTGSRRASLQTAATEDPQTEQPTMAHTPSQPALEPATLLPSDLTPVSTGLAQRGIRSGLAVWRPADAGIAGQVSHVWVVKDLQMPQIRHLLQHAFPDESWETCSQANSLKALIGDHRLQQLVDFMDGQGWALLSPALPQPRMGNQTEFSGRHISYCLNFVTQ